MTRNSLTMCSILYNLILICSTFLRYYFSCNSCLALANLPSVALFVEMNVLAHVRLLYWCHGCFVCKLCLSIRLPFDWVQSVWRGTLVAGLRSPPPWPLCLSWTGSLWVECFLKPDSLAGA